VLCKRACLTITAALLAPATLLAAATLFAPPALLAPVAAAAAAPRSPATPSVSAAAGDRYNEDAPHSPLVERELAGPNSGSRAAAQSQAASPSGVRGIDVASLQHPGGAPIDWAKVAAAGYKFAFIKATEGSYYANPYFGADFKAAKAAGLLAAAYQFAIPNYSSGLAQADYAVDHAEYGADGHTLPLILDIEYDPYVASDHTNECYGLTTTQMTSWIRAFVAEATRRTGQQPAIYTTADWWDECTGSSTAFSADPLWIAGSGTTAPAALPAGWDAWTYWQYTSTATVPGIDGDTDVSVLNAGELALAPPGPQSDQDGTTVSVPVESVNAAGGQALTYTATGLPAGLSVNGAAISGTLPATPGAYAVTITVSGASLPSATEHLTWLVHGPVTLARVPARTGPAGSPVETAVTGRDGLSGCSLTFTASGLPAGLSVSPCGTITGWLARAGTYDPVITVTDSGGTTLARTTFPWRVTAPAASGPTGQIRLGRTGPCLTRPRHGISVAACSSRARSQQWTLAADGTIRAGATCLAVAAANSTSVVMTRCTGAYLQQWRAGSNGAVTSIGSTRCLTATRAGKPATATACAANTSQQWVTPAGPLNAGTSGWCASAWRQPGTSWYASVAACRSSRASPWAAQPDGTISAAGACLMVTADVLGAPLRLARCTGGQAQRWQLLSGTVASELLNPTSGLCLTVPGHHPQGSRLVLGYCDPAGPATTWRLS
jgi:GH25 family lysozyme M1 (1,4-beta-N-acetylmuramidase)